MASFTSEDARKVVPLENEAEYVTAMRGAMQHIHVPTVGGHVVEPLTAKRLLRYLRAAKYDVAGAVASYKRYVDHRIAMFGPGPLAATPGPLSLVSEAQDESGSPRLLLDLAKVDLSEEEAARRLNYAASMWAVIDAALDTGRPAQVDGLVVVVDARSAVPRKHMRPGRLRTLFDSVVGRVPARVKRIEIVGAPGWLVQSWFALGPILKSKIVARARTVDDIDTLPAAVRAHFVDPGDEPPADSNEVKEEEEPPPPSSPPLPPPPQQQRQRRNTPERLTTAHIAAIRESLELTEVELPPDDLVFWSEDDAVVYFATGGDVKPAKTDKPRVTPPVARREYYA